MFLVKCTEPYKSLNEIPAHHCILGGEPGDVTLPEATIFRMWGNIEEELHCETRDEFNAVVSLIQSGCSGECGLFSHLKSKCPSPWRCVELLRQYKKQKGIPLGLLPVSEES